MTLYGRAHWPVFRPLGKRLPAARVFSRPVDTEAPDLKSDLYNALLVLPVIARQYVANRRVCPAE